MRNLVIPGDVYKTMTSKEIVAIWDAELLVTLENLTFDEYALLPDEESGYGQGHVARCVSRNVDEFEIVVWDWAPESPDGEELIEVRYPFVPTGTESW